MQDCHSKLILLLSPIILIAALVTHPVIDDWTYFTRPNDFTQDNFANLFLVNNQWRPFDGALGYILWLKPALFPWINHIIVVTGHVINALILCKIGKVFKLQSIFLYITILIFYLCPGMVATVLNTDSINQVYSHLWGFLGLYIYINYKRKYKILIWCTTIMLSSLCKENGIMWALATPIIAWGLRLTDNKKLRNDILWGILVIVIYLFIRFLNAGYLVNPNSAYINFPLYNRLFGFVKFIGYTFVPLDYVSIVYTPSRNIIFASITALLSLPFIILVLKNFKTTDRRLLLSLLFSIVLLALPHLLTIYTALHPYASLSISSLLIGTIIQKEKNYKGIIVAFVMYLFAILISTGHHWYKSYESGMVGKRMAEKAIKYTSLPIDKVCLIDINNNEEKYSSFCAIPVEAFGWGIAAMQETNYKWPKYIYQEHIEASDKDKIPTLINKIYRRGYKTIWIVDRDSIKVLNE